MKLDSIKTICQVKSIRDGNILQVLSVRGVLDPTGLFRGVDGMTIKLTPVITNDFQLYGYSKISEYKIENHSHIVQYFITL